MVVSIADMRPGQTGIVVTAVGGHGMVSRLNAMGLHPGVVVTRRMGQPMRGPVVLQIGQSQIALGFGVARRIMVEVTS